MKINFILSKECSKIQSMHMILETSTKGNHFVSDSINKTYYKCRRINLNCGASYRDSLDWLKTKKGKCFQYAVLVAKNNEGIVEGLKEY